jgi:hypothetical protein
MTAKDQKTSTQRGALISPLGVLLRFGRIVAIIEALCESPGLGGMCNAHE